MSLPEIRGSVEPGMDIDMITKKSTRQPEDDDAAEVELKELLAVVTRDIRKEIKEHDDEIIAVVRAFGGSAPQYRRERERERDRKQLGQSSLRSTRRRGLQPQRSCCLSFGSFQDSHWISQSQTTMDADGTLTRRR